MKIFGICCFCIEKMKHYCDEFLRYIDKPVKLYNNKESFLDNVLIYLVLYKVLFIIFDIKLIQKFLDNINVLNIIPYNGAILGQNLADDLTYVIITIIFIKVIMIYLNKHLQAKSVSIASKSKIPFEKSLTDYLELNSRKTYLITGPWGSGKTHKCNEFFDKYYPYKSRNIYKISCYGLVTREQVINELNNKIKNDNALIKKIQYLPVIGNIIYNIFLKDRYTYENIRRNSIIVFDDFERIAYWSENTEERLGHSAEESGVLARLEKYNTMIGFVNSLTEEYGVKVIIIADVNRMAGTDKVFRDKLDSKIYYLKGYNASVREIICESAESVVINDENKKKLKEIMELLAHDFLNVLEDCPGSYNLRKIKNLFQVLLDTVFENKVLMDQLENINLMVSILYTLYIIDINKDLDYPLDLDNVHDNGSISFILSPKNTDMIKNSKYKPIWLRAKIIGYKMLNANYEKEKIELIVKNFDYSKYEYTEETLMESKRNLNYDKKEYSYCINHIIFALSFIHGKDDKEYISYAKNMLYHVEKMNNVCSYSDNSWSEEIVERTLDLRGMLRGMETIRDLACVNKIPKEMTVYRDKLISELITKSKKT